MTKKQEQEPDDQAQAHQAEAHEAEAEAEAEEALRRCRRRQANILLISHMNVSSGLSSSSSSSRNITSNRSAIASGRGMDALLFSPLADGSGSSAFPPCFSSHPRRNTNSNSGSSSFSSTASALLTTSDFVQRALDIVNLVDPVKDLEDDYDNSSVGDEN